MRTYRCPRCGQGTKVDARRWRVEHGVFCDYCSAFIINPATYTLVIASLIAITAISTAVAIFYLGGHP